MISNIYFYQIINYNTEFPPSMFSIWSTRSVSCYGVTFQCWYELKAYILIIINVGSCCSNSILSVNNISGSHREYGTCWSNHGGINWRMDEWSFRKESFNPHCRHTLFSWVCYHGCCNQPRYSHCRSSICWPRCWNGFYGVSPLHFGGFTSKSSRSTC